MEMQTTGRNSGLINNRNGDWKFWYDPNSEAIYSEGRCWKKTRRQHWFNGIEYDRYETHGISRTICQELAIIHPSLRVLLNDVEFIKGPYEIKEKLVKSKNSSQRRIGERRIDDVRLVSFN